MRQVQSSAGSSSNWTQLHCLQSGSAWISIIVVDVYHVTIVAKGEWVVDVIFSDRLLSAHWREFDNKHRSCKRGFPPERIGSDPKIYSTTTQQVKQQWQRKYQICLARRAKQVKQQWQRKIPNLFNNKSKKYTRVQLVPWECSSTDVTLSDIGRSSTGCPRHRDKPHTNLIHGTYIRW